MICAKMCAAYGCVAIHANVEIGDHMLGSIKAGHHDIAFVQEVLGGTRRAASRSQPGIIHHRVLGKKLARSRVFPIIYEECQAGKCVLNIDAILETRPSRSEEHTSELQSLMRISYAVLYLKKKTIIQNKQTQYRR